MGSGWNNQLRQVQSTLQGFFGEPAVYTPFGGGTPGVPLNITVIVPLQQSQLILGDDAGSSAFRMLGVEVNISDVAAPQRADTIALSSPSNTGTWMVMRIDKANNSRWLLVCRLPRHDEVSGQGARQVRT